LNLKTIKFSPSVTQKKSFGILSRLQGGIER